MGRVRQKLPVCREPVNRDLRGREEAKQKGLHLGYIKAINVPGPHSQEPLPKASPRHLAAPWIPGTEKGLNR